MEASSPNVVLVQDEKFDFDLDLSDSREEADMNASDEEDEVFFGPIGHRERCIATSTDLREQQLNLSSPKPTLPHHIEVFKEAHFIANLFKKESSNDVKTTDCENLENDDAKENKVDLGTAVAKKVEKLADKEQPVVRAALEENHNRCSPAVKGKSPAVPRETRIQTPSKKKKAFSPVNVDHLYGVDTSQAKNEKGQLGNDTINTSLLELMSDTSRMQDAQGGDSRLEEGQVGKQDNTDATRHKKAGRKSALPPPGFSMSRTRHTSSSSSTSSTSSVCQQNINETTMSQRSSSSSSLNSSFSSQTDYSRQLAKTKSSLKPLGSGLVKPRFARSGDLSKNKLQPVKALPRGQAQSNRTPGKANSSFSEGCTSVREGQRGSGLRNNSDITPVRKRESNHAGPTTPSQGGKNVTTGLPPKGQERQKGAQEHGQRMAVKRREGTAAQGRAASWSKAGLASPARRGTAAQETSRSESIPRKRSTLMARGSTPINKPTTPVKATPTEPREDCSANRMEKQKRTSLGAGRSKRRSLLPTPVSSKPSEPKSRRSCASTGQQNATGPIPFNISPVAPERPQNSVAALEVPRAPKLNVLSDPFSPLAGDNVLATNEVPTEVGTNVSENLISL